MGAMGGVTTLGACRRRVVLSVAAILTIGVVMVYSASYIHAKELHGASLHYAARQLLFALVGAGLAWTASRTRREFWLDRAEWINLAAAAVLLLTLVPHVGAAVKGAHRWIDLAGLRFQPGEFAKATVLLSSIAFFEGLGRRGVRRDALHLASLLAPLGLLALQPDFGTFTICLLSIAFVGYLSDVPRRALAACLGAGALASSVLLVARDYRVERIFSFLDPWGNAQGSGFQIVQSYLAFASGSILGQGLGNSNEKLFYLPEAHNDFIFSVLGEELGFAGVLLVVLLFLALVHSGLSLSLLVRDRRASMLAASITFLFGLQAFLNMGVALGLLPTKGLNLPFVSYGGSSLVANLLLAGLLLSCARGEDAGRAP